ncbi:MAG: hypothetical protein FWF59_11955 [Turicibacter sp.]|nr:hypothetical protein [Turicibacter sp.]
MEAIQEMYNDMNEDKLWSMYLASQADKNYEDWKKQVVGHTAKVKQSGMDKERVDRVVNDSQNILNGFKPT